MTRTLLLLVYGVSYAAAVVSGMLTMIYMLAIILSQEFSTEPTSKIAPAAILLGIAIICGLVHSYIDKKLVKRQ